jgi:hypothetical protein
MFGDMRREKFGALKEIGKNEEIFVKSRGKTSKVLN